MAIQLSKEDFDQLADILTRQQIWLMEPSRWAFTLDMLAGSPRKDDLQGSLDLAGNGRGAAVKMINKLATFGQDAPGRESLGVLINHLMREVGGGTGFDGGGSDSVDGAVDHRRGRGGRAARHRPSGHLSCVLDQGCTPTPISHTTEPG